MWVELLVFSVLICWLAALHFGYLLFMVTYFIICWFLILLLKLPEK